MKTNTELPPQRETALLRLSSLVNLVKASLEQAANSAHHSGLFTVERDLRASLTTIQYVTRDELRDQLLIKLNQGELFNENAKATDGNR